MRFSGVSALAIWGATTRNLTGLGAGTITAVTSQHQTIANGTNADLRPAAGAFRSIMIIGEATLNANYNAALTDGVNFRAGGAGGASNAFQSTFFGNSALGPAIQNTGSASGFYTIGGWDWHQ